MAGDYVNEFTWATGDTSATGPWENLLGRVQVILKDVEPCPDRKYHNGLDFCKLNDKLCVRENEDTCPYYDEYLQELKEEKEDELKEAKEIEQEKEELFNEVNNESYYQ